MHLDTDEWTTASEAARILGVSAQRVAKMATEDGSLDACHPWPRVFLIGRSSLEAWMTGERQGRILPADARRFVLKHTGHTSIHLADPGDVEGWLLGFIIDARPRWSGERQREWATEMAGRLLTSGAA